jgi:hypothetical protein
MKKVKLIFFGPGQKAGHEGVTYVAELQAKGGLCECPRGRVCVDAMDGGNIIFKKA